MATVLVCILVWLCAGMAIQLSMDTNKAGGWNTGTTYDLGGNDSIARKFQVPDEKKMKVKVRKLRRRKVENLEIPDQGILNRQRENVKDYNDTDLKRLVHK